MSLTKAALFGAVVGAVLPVFNVLLQGELAAVGVAGFVLMIFGGAFGGAVLFVFIALVGNALLR